MEFFHKAICKNCDKEIMLAWNLQWPIWIHSHNMSMYCNENQAEPVKGSVKDGVFEVKR